MPLVRYRPNRRGLRAMLGAEWVRADLHRRAEAVAAVADAAYRAQPPHSGAVDVEVVSETGDGSRLRSRAAVIARHPAALHIEADRRVLGSAIDAAAGFD
jgi:hypothetical protein